MKVVARWYDVNVFWENVSQKEVTFTGKMKRYDDFSKVVEMLEMTGNTEFMIKENNIFIDLHIVIQYGIKISTVCENIIENVKYNVENLTGLTVKKVNVNVHGIKLEGN